LPEKEIYFNITRNEGRPCIWEEGGATTNKGRAIIIAGPKGEKKKAVYQRTSGHLACKEHALIPIETGDFIIVANQWRGEYSITVARIKEFKRFKEWDCDPHDDKVVAEVVESPPEFLFEAINAAKAKAAHYHCRGPHFVLNPAK
jgi:hypothetical protein